VYGSKIAYLDISYRCCNPTPELAKVISASSQPLSEHRSRQRIHMNSVESHTISWSTIAAKVGRSRRSSTWASYWWASLCKVSTNALRLRRLWWWRCETWTLSTTTSHDLTKEVVRAVTD
jgi:hypothetical protein